MDRRHHSIQLSAGPGDDGLMSSELYLAVCGGKKEEAMALLLQLNSGKAARSLHTVESIHQVSAERNNVFHLAADQGHDELIRKLYASFGDKSLLSSPNSALDTPLHCAARAGHEMAVSLLVQLAMDTGDQSILCCKNEAGDTALHLAARLGHGTAVEAMVSTAPGLASEVNNAGLSPLYLAVMSKSAPAVRAITTRCSDASAAGPSSQNALHAAVFQGSEMVSLLLDWKPSGPSLASKADGTGSTPLHFASSDGDRSVVCAILRVAPHAVRMRDSGGLSALHVAAGMGHAHVAEALMKACPDAAELRDDRGGTFLHAAARGGHTRVVSLAMKKPTPRSLLNTHDEDGNTPLHLAVAACAPSAVEALMWRGELCADVMNNEGQTPLDLAARSTSFFSMLALVVTLATFGAQSRPQRRDHVEQWRGRDIAQGIEKMSDSLAVVGVLIATVTFTAANNVPGSYEQADDTAPDKRVFKGMAVLQEKILFQFFLILDSFALVTSVLAVVLLVFGKASRSAGSWKSFAAALHCIWVSLVSMFIAFYAALAAVTSTEALYRIIYHVIYIGFALLYGTVVTLIVPVSACTLWKALWCTVVKGRHNVLGRRLKQQYPVARAYAPHLILFMATNYVAIAGFVAVSILSEQAAREARHPGAPAPAPSSALLS
ncbi:ankyrin repeat-containing protein At5g02620 isoform X2 [Triticum aestivum]|uniref:ankyrin repeat-containing protein At5g02620 isoform X2 n=1 Tax=Triticum aestivum TaxID=4565 RepID=UPI001D00D49F|nr:ankyrin repeat-containing protein At5g02620-like isoform X2 [Triticum aestivum]